MKHKSRSLIAMLLILAMTFTLVPSSAAEAAAKKMNVKKLHMWSGDTFQLSVKGAKGPFTWSTSARRYAYPDEKGLVTANREGEADITATSKKGKTFKCHVTVEDPYFDYNPARLMVGQPRSLNFHGPEGTVFEANKPDVLSIDENGVATALAVADDLVVTAICPSGRKVQCKLIAGYNINDYEQAADEWGVLHVNNRKYEWIPEATYDHPKPSQMRQILIDAMLHGTDRITLINMSREDAFMEYGLEQRSNLCQDLYFNYAPWVHILSTVKELNDGIWSVQLAYDLGTRIMFSMTIKDYDLKKAIELTKQAVAEGDKYVAFPALFAYTYEDAVAVMDKIKPVVAEILNNPTINTDMEVIKYVHDYICDIATYYKDYDKVISYEYPQYWDAHGILLYGEGTCASYTDVMMLFLTYLGFQNVKQQDVAPVHVWNKVLVNKRYYNIDVQSDDTRYEEFLLGKNDGRKVSIDETNHNTHFFCLSDDEFERARIQISEFVRRTVYFYIR